MHKPERRPLPKQIGLKPDERNLLSVLPRQICEQAANYEDTNDWDKDKGEEMEYLPDLNAPTALDKLLTNENFKLIQDILGCRNMIFSKTQKYYMKSVEWQNWQRLQKYWSFILTDHSSLISSQKQRM